MHAWQQCRAHQVSGPRPARRSTDGGAACAAQVDDATLEVTELPVRRWTQDYKEFLEGLIKPEGDRAGAPVLADYREHHSDADVHFSLQLLPGQMGPALAAGLHARFKLTTKVSCGACAAACCALRVLHSRPEPSWRCLAACMHAWAGQQGCAARAMACSDTACEQTAPADVIQLGSDCI